MQEKKLHYPHQGLFLMKLYCLESQTTTSYVWNDRGVSEMLAVWVSR